MAYLHRKWNRRREHAWPSSRRYEFSSALKPLQRVVWRKSSTKCVKFAGFRGGTRTPDSGALVRAQTRQSVFATTVPVSLQVSHHCLCSFHIYELLSLYFTMRTSARSRRFRHLLPLKAVCQLVFGSEVLAQSVLAHVVSC